MTGDHARALVLVGALVTGGSLVGVQPGHAPTAPVVRTIKAPHAAPLAKLAFVDRVPLPAARPKIEPKPKPKAEPKPRPLKKSLPSCAHIKREKARMSLAEQWSAYLNASPEEIAHGRRCLKL